MEAPSLRPKGSQETFGRGRVSQRIREAHNDVHVYLYHSPEMLDIGEAVARSWEAIGLKVNRVRMTDSVQMGLLQMPPPPLQLSDLF